MKTLFQKRIFEAANFRHGIVMPAQNVQNTFADLPIYNVGVPQDTLDEWKSASGGVGFDADEAKTAAICEALERYSSVAHDYQIMKREELKNFISLEEFSLFTKEQREEKDFPFAEEYAKNEFVKMFSLYNNSEVFIPKSLIALTDKEQSIASSSGLAVGKNQISALLRAVQELVERDALMITWLHGIRGRQVQLNDKYKKLVTDLGGEIFCIDATPAWSSHPVALVTGNIPKRGLKRYSLGAACRATWEEAVEKAFLEWYQGIIFAGMYQESHKDLKFKIFSDVQTFDHHALYYTAHPEMWNKIPLIRGEKVSAPKTKKPKDDRESLETLSKSLQAAKIKVYYRELTTVDLAQIGLSCVKVISPDLTSIFCDQRWPYLGGKTSDVLFRYPWAKTTSYPNSLPHPLG